MDKNTLNEAISEDYACRPRVYFFLDSRYTFNPPVELMHFQLALNRDVVFLTF